MGLVKALAVQFESQVLDILCPMTVFAVYPECGCHYFTEASQTALTPIANRRPSVTMATALPECDTSFLSLLHCSGLGLPLAHLPLGWPHSSAPLVLLPSLLDPSEGLPCLWHMVFPPLQAHLLPTQPGPLL